jgi:DNA-directed RNA polymerase specialized sigma subunit
VDAELAKLPENQEKVLRLRYIEGLRWEKVAKNAKYCERQCYRLSKKYVQQTKQKNH